MVVQKVSVSQQESLGYGQVKNECLVEESQQEQRDAENGKQFLMPANETHKKRTKMLSYLKQ